jgi:hypothetical protein
LVIARRSPTIKQGGPVLPRRSTPYGRAGWRPTTSAPHFAEGRRRSSLTASWGKWLRSESARESPRFSVSNFPALP